MFLCARGIVNFSFLFLLIATSRRMYYDQKSFLSVSCSCSKLPRTHHPYTDFPPLPDFSFPRIILHLYTFLYNESLIFFLTSSQSCYKSYFRPFSFHPSFADYFYKQVILKTVYIYQSYTVIRCLLKKLWINFRCSKHFKNFPHPQEWLYLA